MGMKEDTRTNHAQHVQTSWVAQANLLYKYVPLRLYGSLHSLLAGKYSGRMKHNKIPENIKAQFHCFWATLLIWQGLHLLELLKLQLYAN